VGLGNHRRLMTWYKKGKKNFSFLSKKKKCALLLKRGKEKRENNRGKRQPLLLANVFVPEGRGKMR